MSNKYFDDIDYKLLDEKTAYRGKRIVVEELHYKNPRTNQIIYREHVLAGHAAVIIPETEDKQFIMIKEPRTPIGKNVLAFPAGMIEEGEKPEDGAIRELEEETGYKAKNIEPIIYEYPAVGYSDEKAYIFKATDLTKTQRHLDDTEDIKVRKISIEELKELYRNGEIHSSAELIAILSYFAKI